MKMQSIFTKSRSSALCMLGGVLLVFACQEAEDPMKPPFPSNIIETKEVKSSAWMDFNSNIEKTLVIDMPDGQITKMEFYLIRHASDESQKFKIPGYGIDNKSYYSYNVLGTSRSNRLTVKIQRMSGTGESYHGVSTLVTTRPEPIVQK